MENADFPDSRRPLQYEPLAASEIRLLELQKHPDQANEVSVGLKRYSLEENPIYIALSYVWGDRRNTNEIKVDGNSYQATESLYHALSYIIEQLGSLRQFLPSRNKETKIYIWVDAICINQNDLDEKSRQIPMMGRIYSLAQSVVVWMGQDAAINSPDAILLANFITKREIAIRSYVDAVFSSVNQDTASASQSDTTKAIDVAKSTILSKLKVLDKLDLKNMLGERFHTVLLQFDKLMKCPWWSRVWVLQEYVLSRQTPICLPGFFSVRVLLNIYNSARTIEAEVNEEEATVIRSLAMEGMLQVGQLIQTNTLLAKDYHQKALAAQLIKLMSLTVGKKATIPHDYVYGILGMISPTAQLPSELVPNYTLPFAEVYFNFTKYLVENTGNLSVLTHRGERLEGYPTWVPDLRHSMLYTDEPLSRPGRVAFSPGGQNLSVQATKLGVGLDHCGPTEQFEAYLSKFDTMLKVSSEIQDRSATEVLEKFLAIWMKHSGSPKNIEMRCQTISELWQHTNNAPDLTDPELNARRNFFGHFHEQSYILLDNGHIFIYRGCRPEPNDEIWALRTLRTLSVLRRVEDKYNYVGFATGYTESFNLTDEFFEARTVVEITLS